VSRQAAVLATLLGCSAAPSVDEPSIEPEHLECSPGHDPGAIARARPTPIERYGRLRVDGVQLRDACDRPVQLRGVSDQGIQWFPWGTCIDDASLELLTGTLATDVVRVPVYLEEDGWLDDPEGMTARAHLLIDHAIDHGLYVIVDWHVTSFDPGDRLPESLEFWTHMAAAYAGVPNVIYEIANEPAEVDWAGIVRYAEPVIAAIRAIDPDVPIIVGTPDDSGELAEVVAAPLTGAAATNVLYTFHFYAASMRLDQVVPYLGQIPLFVTEWSAASYSGDAPDAYARAAEFVAALDSAAQRVSWTAWSFTDDAESSAMLRPGTCAIEPGAGGGPWSGASLSSAGVFVCDALLDGERPPACR
jgi:Cellulase (glycosyl hydrolase family 5)